MIMLGSTEFRRVGPSSWDVDVRLADMDADGVDVQVVSPTPVFFCYDQPAAEAARMARSSTISRWRCALPAPERLLPMCQVPLQDPDAACAELDRCMDAGHVGVEIGNHVGDRDLDDAGIVTFLQHCGVIGSAGVRPSRGTCRTRPAWTAGWPAG